MQDAPVISNVSALVPEHQMSNCPVTYNKLNCTIFLDWPNIIRTYRCSCHYLAV